MPQVSVIVPVYNVEKYIRRCVDSILAQTFEDFELILVDDGSPDNCPAICDEYAAKDNRVRVIHQENGGVSGARNAALNVVTGEYIAFCDSDDWWETSFLESMVSSAHSSRADMVMTGYRAVDDNGKELWCAKNEGGQFVLRSDLQRTEFIICSILCGKTRWEVWTKLFRANIIKQHQIFFCTTCGNYAEDVGFIMEFCLFADTLCGVDVRGYNYFVRTDSMVRTSEDIPKIHEKNEVSAHLGKTFHDVIHDQQAKKLFPVIHHLLLRWEYGKMIEKGKWNELANGVAAVKNTAWYRKNYKELKTCSAYLTSLFGERETQNMLMLARFAMHKNIVFYRMERILHNRILVGLINWGRIKCQG